MTQGEAELRLWQASWLADPDLQALFAVLGIDRTRAVGGVVRDTLLGLPSIRTDIDLATELLPAEVVARAAAAGIASYPTGIEHGTVTLKHNGLLAEVTTLREDIETDGRHAVVRFGRDWRRDAERRDFTMNALYVDARGRVLDPIGGLADCLAGQVRFIGDPDRRIAEDRLRVYRFFRFTASHGHQLFDATGLAACHAAVTAMSGLSAERIGAEMTRMLALPQVADTLLAMADIGLLPLALSPERLHAYEALPTPTLPGRLALITAPAGAASLQPAWRLSNDLVKAAADTWSAAQLLMAGAVAEAAYRHLRSVRPALAVAAAHDLWPRGRYDEALTALDALPVPQFPISGADLLAAGLKPGKAMGAELSRLERQWIESGFALDRTSLLNSIRP